MFLFVAALVGACPAFAQDKILDRKGNELIVNVTAITPDSVFYSEYSDSVSQKVYAVSKKQLFMITFKNGTKEVFPEGAVMPETPKLTREEYYRLGQQDASNNFKSRPAFWGTFAASVVPILAPVGGIAAATAISLKNPRPQDIKPSNPENIQNPYYIDGYNNRAKKKKLGSAAGGFLAGTGVLYIGLVLALSGAL